MEVNTNLAPITDLWKEFTFLGPNYSIPVVLDGLVFPTLKHALEATKTRDQKEREELINKHPFWATEWGRLRPFDDDPYKEEWEREISDLTLILTAQKFGLVDVINEEARNYDKLRMKLAFWLTLTHGRTIRYENTHCDTYWGICFCGTHLGERSRYLAPGNNAMGSALMTIREKLIRGLSVRSFTSATCDWCYIHRAQTVTPATQYMLYFRRKNLVCRSFCPKHYRAESHDARKASDGKVFVYDISDVPSEIEMRPVAMSLLVPRRAWTPPPNRQLALYRSNPTPHYNTCASDSREFWGHLVILPDNSQINNVIGAV